METERKHYYDAVYEIWRAGYNPDTLDIEQSSDDFNNGLSPQYTADREILSQRKQIEAKRERERNTEEICYNCEICCNCYSRDF